MRIRENLNYLIEKNGIMNKFLATQLEVSGANITRYRKGETIPPIDKIIKMCELFEVDLTAFVLEDLSQSDGPDVVREPGVSYQRRLEAENKELQARVNQLELALHRHIKDRDILRRYVKDA